MGGKWLTKEDEERIIERYLEGDDSPTIAKDIGYSSRTVLNVLERNNIEIGFKDKPLKEYTEIIGGKNVRKIPPKEEILLRFFYLKEEGKLLHKRTLKETKPSKHGYKICSFGALDGKQIRYKEHRLIFFLETGQEPDEIDHIDGNKQNNHISNLRASTSKQNRANTQGRRGSKSKYKGVIWSSKNLIRPWGARITSGSKKYFLGYFEDEKNAAIAYNEKAKELHGEFAFLNKIEEDL